MKSRHRLHLSMSPESVCCSPNASSCCLFNAAALCFLLLPAIAGMRCCAGWTIGMCSPPFSLNKCSILVLLSGNFGKSWARGKRSQLPKALKGRSPMLCTSSVVGAISSLEFSVTQGLRQEAEAGKLCEGMLTRMSAYVPKLAQWLCCLASEAALSSSEGSSYPL